MQKYKGYSVFYKIDNSFGWKLRWLNATKKECEKICKNENYIDYKILDLNPNDFAFDLHLRTNITYFNGKYYFPDENIPFPTTDAEKIENFKYTMNFETGYGDDCKDNLIINLRFILPEKTFDMAILSKNFIQDFPIFLENLNTNKCSIYHNEEYSSFKWLVWIKDDFVRWICQDYSENSVKIIFDVIVSKTWFFSFGETLISTIHYKRNK